MHKDYPRIWVGFEQCVKSKEVEWHLQKPPVCDTLVLQMLEETLVESVGIFHFLEVISIQPFSVGWHVELSANRVASATVLQHDEGLLWKLSALCMDAYPLFRESQLAVEHLLSKLNPRILHDVIQQGQGVWYEVGSDEMYARATYVQATVGTRRYRLLV